MLFWGCSTSLQLQRTPECPPVYKGVYKEIQALPAALQEYGGKTFKKYEGCVLRHLVPFHSQYFSFRAGPGRKPGSG